MEKLKPDAALMNALNFDENDLEYNREGEFSPAQQQNLYQRKQTMRMFTILSGCSILICILLAFSANPTSVMGILGLIIAGLALIVTGTEWLEIDEDLQKRRVNEYQGSVRLVVETLVRGGPVYKVHIDDERWSIDKVAFLAFKNEDPYIIYFAPHSRKILSAEWLR